jgi:hypothetical protein
MERNSKLAHEAMSRSPPKKPRRLLSCLNLSLPFVTNDRTVCSPKLIRRNSSKCMGSVDGNDGWPQEASIIHVPSALKLNLLEYPFSWSMPDNSSRSGSRLFGDLRSLSALSVGLRPTKATSVYR